MTVKSPSLPVHNTDRFFIGGEWVAPSTESTIDVVDAGTEEVFMTVAEAQAADIDRSVTAASEAFERGPWPRLTHAERAAILREFGAAVGKRGEALGQISPRECGVLYRFAQGAGVMGPAIFESYAALVDTFPFEEPAQPTGPGYGLLVREPVGVVGAIVPWNSPLSLIAHKMVPALLAGCAVVVKMAPEAPGAGYVLAEAAEEVGLPPGVVNFLTAGREVSEMLVRDPRVDKISFTGSTAAGRKIASLCGERIARCTLELGGKSAAVILDDADLQQVATTISAAESMLTGQICSSLTRLVVTRSRHDELVDALTSTFAKNVGSIYQPRSRPLGRWPPVARDATS
jgi:acyl-CoA reductase-like NAD-dependent aldehyde dehydrogenase